MASRNPVQREGQGQLEGPERPLLLRVTGDAVLKAERTDKRGNIPWRSTAPPDSNGTGGIELPTTAGWEPDGAICTQDGKKLSHLPDFPVKGPSSVVHRQRRAARSFTIGIRQDETTSGVGPASIVVCRPKRICGLQGPAVLFPSVQTERFRWRRLTHGAVIPWSSGYAVRRRRLTGWSS